MSNFDVTVEEIEKVSAHVNADRLDVCKLKGKDLQFVTQKALYAPGAQVLYFPVDAILPDRLIEALNLTGKLSGKEKNRIKTIKLRGEISQGVVAPVKKFFPAGINTGLVPGYLASYLGVTKYDPPVTFSNDVDMRPIGGLGLSAYDIESADRYTEIAELLMDQPCVITEKMEGTNFNLYIDENDVPHICSRNYELLEKEGQPHLFWETARNQGLIARAREIKQAIGKPVTLRGELIGPGVQNNIYKLKTHCVMLFDIATVFGYLNPYNFLTLCEDYNLLRVPIICGLFIANKTLREFLEGKTIKEFSNGESSFVPGVMREGIVIKPAHEQTHPEIGRLFLKQRSPEYLAKYDN